MPPQLYLGVAGVLLVLSSLSCILDYLVSHKEASFRDLLGLDLFPVVAGCIIGSLAWPLILICAIIYGIVVGILFVLYQIGACLAGSPLIQKLFRERQDG